MAESYLHRILKAVSMRTLRENSYTIYPEPEYSPIQYLSWFSYRPDIFGVRSVEGADEYAFVECETKPRMKRILSKNYLSISVQSRLAKETRSRMILAIPTGTLRNLDTKIRERWEIWIINQRLGETDTMLPCLSDIREISIKPVSS
ncbi:MAG: hypothetical protein HY619_05385 [Thaumarchaeota archaeon]|nr:hypothetical protein [Nitrososphaerota archaeon]